MNFLMEYRRVVYAEKGGVSREERSGQKLEQLKSGTKILRSKATKAATKSDAGGGLMTGWYYPGSQPRRKSAWMVSLCEPSDHAVRYGNPRSMQGRIVSVKGATSNGLVV